MNDSHTSTNGYEIDDEQLSMSSNHKCELRCNRSRGKHFIIKDEHTFTPTSPTDEEWPNQAVKYNKNLIQRPSHMTHYACKEMLDKHGNETMGCCCTGHVCKEKEDE